MVAGEAPRDERARDVRAADRGLAGLREHRVHRERDAELVQSRDDRDRTVAPRDAIDIERMLQRFRARDVETEDVGLVARRVDRAQLDAGDHAHAESLTGLPCFRNAGEGIVVGEGDRQEPCLPCRLDDTRRRDRPIGGGRVHVQIDETARVAHRAYPASGEVAPGCERAKSSARSSAPSSARDASRARVPCGE